MKHLAVALIVVGLIGADLASDLWMNGSEDNDAWALADTIGLLLACAWFWHHRDREDDCG